MVDNTFQAYCIEPGTKRAAMSSRLIDSHVLFMNGETPSHTGSGIRFYYKVFSITACCHC